MKQNLSLFIRQIFLIAAAIILTVNLCHRVESQDSLPVGVITEHLRLVKTPIHRSIVPLKIDGVVLICTSTHPGITSESKVGMETSKGNSAWARLMDIIEDGQELASQNEDFQFKHSKYEVCFFPLLLSAPSSDSANECWHILRDRAIDLSNQSQRSTVPQKAIIASCRVLEDGKLIQYEAEVNIGDRQVFDDSPHLKDDPLSQFKLDTILQSSESGALCLDRSVSKDEELAPHLFGICVETTVNSIDDLKNGVFRVDKAVLDVRTILRLYHMLERP